MNPYDEPTEDKRGQAAAGCVAMMLIGVVLAVGFVGGFVAGWGMFG